LSNTSSRTVTPEGHRRLEAKLAELEQRLSVVLKEKAEAAEIGGNAWHDNFSFEQAERDERALRRQIAEVTSTLRTAEVIETRQSTDRVEIGATVEIELEAGDRRSITIVGHGESAPPTLISYDAPLGQALLGGRAGDERAFRVGGRTARKVKIISISG
jgi:transcription elongation factor GreA